MRDKFGLDKTCGCCRTDSCDLTNCTWSSTDMNNITGTGYDKIVSGTGGVTGAYSKTNVQIANNGNPAPARQVIIDATSAPSVQEYSYAISLLDGATINPSQSCTVSDVRFCIESKRVNGTLPIKLVFVVSQAGKIYISGIYDIGSAWDGTTATLSQNDFSNITGDGTHPNFGITGTALQFGFALRVTFDIGVLDSVEVWFDNLCVHMTQTHPCYGDANDLCDILSCLYLYNDGQGSEISQIQSNGTVAVPNGTLAVGTLIAPDGSDGTPAPCCNFHVVSNNITRPFRSMLEMYTLVGEQFILSPFNDITRINGCINGKGSVVLSGPYLTSVDIGFAQNGEYHFILSSSTSAGQVYFPTTWTRRSFYTTIPHGFSKRTLTTRVLSTGPDFTQPVQLCIYFGQQINENSTYDLWIDNICLKTVRNPTLLPSIVANFNNTTITNNGGGTNAGSAIAAFNSVLSGNIVMTGYSSEDQYIWNYSLTNSGYNMNVSLILDNYNGSNFTDGYLMITIHYGSISTTYKRLYYTVNSPISATSLSGTFVNPVAVNNGSNTEIGYIGYSAGTTGTIGLP